MLFARRGWTVMAAAREWLVEQIRQPSGISLDKEVGLDGHLPRGLLKPFQQKIQ